MKLVLELDAKQYALLITSLSQAKTACKQLDWADRVESIDELTDYVRDNVDFKFEAVA